MLKSSGVKSYDICSLLSCVLAKGCLGVHYNFVKFTIFAVSLKFFKISNNILFKDAYIYVTKLHNRQYINKI